jgi:hypothetical protein
VLVVALAAGVTSSLSGCSVFLALASHQPTTEENLANQRKVALQTIRDYPNPALESIRFTTEGHANGAGGWAANAVVTIDGQQYEEIVGTSLSGGDAVLTVPPGSISGPFAVAYIDGTSEVLE